MRICFNTPIRLVSGATLATVLNLSLGACSPVVLQEESESEGTAGTGGTTDGASSSAEGGSEGGSAEGGGEGGTVPEGCINLEPRLLGVLETNCAKCHGQGSAGLGGIDYILDLNELISQNKVVPGSADGSRIFARMTDAAAPMPPLSEMQRPNETDVAVVEKWINECAGVQSCADQPFISRDAMLQKINQDLSTINLETLPFTRYFSFVHLHNAGFCDAEIEIFRQSLSKLVNSLSHGTLIKAPIAIDEERLIFRIDIGDYKWEAVAGKEFRLSEPSVYFPDVAELNKVFPDIWEMIADQDPYTVEFIGDLAVNIKSQTKTNFPILQGDAFIDAASRSPLYYDILGIPTRSGQLRPDDPPCVGIDDCLETQLGISILGNIAKEFEQNDDVVGRAGFKKSDVSEFNRVVERHLFEFANNRVFWVSYDFAGQNGLQNILVHPLDFDFDGGEIIFSLENGLQGYMLTDAAGTRLNEGPTEIVQDPSQKDQKVRNGVSCMGCHNAGMIKVNDDIRYALDAGMSGTLFDDATKDQIRDLYPIRADFDLLQQEDIERFNAGLVKAGVTVGGEKEPVLTTFLAFDDDVSLRRVGAEYDLNETDMLKNLGKLGDDLSDLAEGATIQRGDFTANFAVGACILKLGCSRACPGAGGSADSRQCTSIDIDGDGIVDEL
jgi:hypothetical protein